MPHHTETIQGTDGAFAAAGFAGHFMKWAAQIISEVFNTTGFGDKGWKTGKNISGQVVGEAVGVITTTDPFPAAFTAETCGVESFEADVTLTIATGKTITFKANISAVDLGRAEEGSDSSVYRVSFASSGPVTKSWGA